MIKRTIISQLEQRLSDPKAIIIQGARQVGKTTLLRDVLKNRTDVLWVNGDLPQQHSLWANAPSISTLRRNLIGYKYLVIDEAQRIKNIGLTVKVIIDEALGVKPILTGSSTLNLASSVNEPLTGRKWSFELYPLTYYEIEQHYKPYPARQQLEDRLILGSYPEIVSQAKDPTQRLRELTSSYLYKDILDYGDIRKPEIIDQLLRALAYQVGSLVSYNELGNMLQVSNDTIRRYIQLLEESYVIFRLPPLSTNPQKEIVTSRKIYFVDNGIRNALIDDFRPLQKRNDLGQLWENFVVSELFKSLKHQNKGGRLFFWRSKDGAEVDVVRQINGLTTAFEIKYNPKKKVRFPASFLNRYQPDTTKVINLENFPLWLGDDHFG